MVNSVEAMLPVPGLGPVLDGLLGPLLRNLAAVDVAGLPRDSESATVGDSTGPESHTTQPPAPPSTPAVSHPNPPGPTS